MEECIDVKQDIADIKQMLLRAEKNLNKYSSSSSSNLLKEIGLPDDFLRPEGLSDGAVKDDSLNRGNTKTYASVSINGIAKLDKTSSGATQHANRTKTHIRGSMQLQSSDAGGLRSSQQQIRRDLALFIGRCDRSVTENDVLMHCKNFCKINPISCSQLVTRSTYYKSFKLTVAAKDRGTLLAADLWPDGIYVDKYYNRSLNHNGTQNTFRQMTRNDSNSSSNSGSVVASQQHELSAIAISDVDNQQPESGAYASSDAATEQSITPSNQ